jgi:aspartate racemase
MKEKTIGVLGGMGPEATLEFFGKIIAATPAARDQDHLRVVIDSNPKVPDRTAAIVVGGESPLPAMTAGIQALQRAGADFVVIPCVSAHAFIDELQGAGLPILSMFEATVTHIREHHPAIRTVGLLATTGTLRAGRFAADLRRAGLRVLDPEASDQKRIMGAIYAIKGVSRPRQDIAAEVRSVAERLIAQGAAGIITGCTELPLVLRPGDLALPVFDTLSILARATVAHAGVKPREAVSV